MAVPGRIAEEMVRINGECHDEILVDALKQYIAGIPEQDAAPRLIVLHQMGATGRRIMSVQLRRSTVQAFLRHQRDSGLQPGGTD